MKVLLVAVNAKYIHSNLAVYDLKAYTENIPVEVELAEYTINQQQEEILRDIYEHKADVVAFSCYIWNITYVKALAEELHKIAPQVQIWFGGPEASYDAKQLLRELSYVELVIVGEGEETFAQLLQKHLLDGERLENIVGICYRENTGEICDNGIREYLPMDKIPFVYHNLDRFAHKILYYETSRGCPFRCSYCLSSIDKRVRLRSLSLVFPELQFFLDNKVDQVKFVDRTFNCNHEHAYEIWKYLLEHDNGITNFHFEVAADLLREEDFALFAQMRKGLIQLEIGIQSTYPDTITEIRRVMDVGKVAECVARVKKMHNIHQHLDLIAGLPFETFAQFQQSFNDVYAMRPDQLQLGFLKVLKGSYMEEKKEDYEIISTSEPPYEVLATKWLSYEERSLLKDVEEMVEVYYNSGQFMHTLEYLLAGREDTFSFYLQLSRYYRQREWMGYKHTRLFRYDALRAFVSDGLQRNMTAEPENISESDPKRSVRKDTVCAKFEEELLTEYLLHDLYLTENSKKRPDWACDDTETKQRLKQIRDPRWRAQHLKQEQAGQIEKILANRTDLHLEYYPKMCGGYLLYDYSQRDPLTNEAKVYEIAMS